MSVSPTLLVRVPRGDQGNNADKQRIRSGGDRESDQKLVHNRKSLRIDNIYLDFRESVIQAAFATVKAQNRE